MDRPASGRVVVLGAGRVGGALHTLWSQAGIAVAPPWSRPTELPTAELSAADVVVLAVRDEAITAVAERLRSVPLRASCVVVHCSGAHAAAELLAPLARLACGTLHPLVAVRSAEQGVAAMPRAFWTLEGTDKAVAVCAVLVEAIGARWVRLDAAQLALYHAAAVIASNHAVVLWTAARDLLQRCGVGDSAAATAMLLPLLGSALENVERFGLPGALTGPLRRGDAATITRHLQVLSTRAPEVWASYRADALLGLGLLRRELQEQGREDDPLGRDLASIAATLLAASQP